MKLGIIREGKIPPDTRVALTPEQCKNISNSADIEICVERSPNRCYSDSEYIQAGIQVVDSVRNCDILLGVKEVPVNQLIPKKTYFFFSHTIKKQPYNKKLLQTILEHQIQLVDYEVLTNEAGQRLIAFGKFAGMVGAHNALWTYGMRSSLFSLPRMFESLDYATIQEIYKGIEFPLVKIVLTGMGRVANGAASVLQDMGIERVSPDAFLMKDFEKAVFTQLGEKEYVKRKDNADFIPEDFFEDPLAFESAFKPYTRVADIMINGIYWDNRAPAFFTVEDMMKNNFKIQVIADVTCDIAPVSSIPSTLRASTIADPVFCYDPKEQQEINPFDLNGVDMMTIDNLPNELPRDASVSFGEQFIEQILPELQKNQSDVIERGTIAKDGQLTDRFSYLKEYVGESSKV